MKRPQPGPTGRTLPAEPDRRSAHGPLRNETTAPLIVESDENDAIIR